MTIDDFCKKLNDFERQYPADASDSLEEGAKKMVKAIKKIHLSVKAITSES